LKDDKPILRRMSPLLALFGRAALAIESPVSGVKRTLRLRVPTSAFDPQRKWCGLQRLSLTARLRNVEVDGKPVLSVHEIKEPSIAASAAKKPRNDWHFSSIGALLY